MNAIIGFPERTEAAPYYFTYIDQVKGDNILDVLEAQAPEAGTFWSSISEEKSRHRYAPDKWTLRQVVGHINDCERMFVFRALWFARGLPEPLPSFDQNIAVTGGEADRICWAEHVEEFRRVRTATLSFFRNLPEEAWLRSGVASGKTFTVRALAYIAAGHVTHHIAIIKARYL